MRLNLHLLILDQEPIQTGRFGCDFRWNDDFTAYWQMPHRWLPGSDSSYARWQAGDYDDEWQIEVEIEPLSADDAAAREAEEQAAALATFDADDIPF